MACVGGALATDTQGAALLAWKRTLRGGAETLGDWRDTDASPCRWTGVSCNAAGRVTELSLQFIDLHGGVLADLSASVVGAMLTRLVLTGTNLTAPSRRGSGTCRHWRTSTSATTLMGSIPAALCRPGSRLESLYLKNLLMCNVRTPLLELEDEADEWGPPGSDRSCRTRLSERERGARQG